MCQSVRKRLLREITAAISCSMICLKYEHQTEQKTTKPEKQLIDRDMRKTDNN